MDTVLEHTDGNVYRINTTPHERMFASIERLHPRRASGVIARFLEETTGEKQYTYNVIIMEDDELITLVLDLGHKKFRSKAWKNLFDWAYSRDRRERRA